MGPPVCISSDSSCIMRAFWSLRRIIASIMIMSLGDWDKADATITLGLQNYLSVTAKNASSIGLDAATLGFLHRLRVVPWA